MPISALVKAVFLDFGDTLVITEPPYVERLRLSFEKLGVSRTYAEMEKAYIEADWRSALALLKRKPFPQDAWRSLFAAIMTETLNITSNTKELMQNVSEEMADIRPRRKLVEGAKEFLDFCAGRKLGLALLSNNDGRTFEKCADVGIENYFDLILDSTIENIIKPNPAIFTRALEKMKLKPEDALHVGDLLGCDVLGAQKAGIKTVWLQMRDYAPAHADIKPDYTVSSFEEISELLREA